MRSSVAIKRRLGRELWQRNHLRLCGAGKVTHLLRSTSPAQTLAAANAFDAALLHACEALAALDPLTTDQALQCQLPLRHGGHSSSRAQQL